MRTTAITKLFIGFFAVSFLAFAVDAPSQFPYCENVVKPVPFDAQGNWIVTDVATQSEVPSLGRLPQRRLIGARITVAGSRVHFVNKQGRAKVPFRTPVLGQQTYDTHSKEFWLDFVTAPQDLQLPHYVSAVNVELGTILSAGPSRVYLEYSGVWFSLKRADGNSQ